MTPSRTKDVRASLKDFQQATVDHVCEHLLGKGGTGRYLVADEVGLGKTLVARGVIGEAIPYFEKRGVQRIDVVYICSNAEIARQNVKRLNVLDGGELAFSTRITLLPQQLRQLKRTGVNLVSFTPGTSFELRGGLGIADERILLYWMLQRAWGPSVVKGVGALRFLKGGVRDVKKFGTRVQWAKQQPLDSKLVKAFADALREYDRDLPRAERLRHRFVEVRDWYRAHGRVQGAHHRDRSMLIGELRRVLARTCIQALEPDLVILDEFQRFKHLLDPDDPAGELAQHLFGYPDVKVLLLSATPYKMYTLPEERALGDDHYVDFIDTQRFLLGDKEVRILQVDLAAMNKAFLALGSEASAVEDAVAAARRVERRLRRVMSRTERVGATADRDSMLREHAVGLVPTVNELAAFTTLDRVASLLGGGDVVEYWKAAPYTLNLMDDYKLKRTFDNARSSPTKGASLAKVLDGAYGLLSETDLANYERLDPGCERLDSIGHHFLESGAWRLLWIPPSLRYHAPAGPFAQAGCQDITKRLVFSAWNVAPKAISALLSYEVERRMLTDDGAEVMENTKEARKQIRPLLRFQHTAGRLTGMPVFATVYPSPTLAALGDPFSIASQNASNDLPLAGVLAAIRSQLEPLVEPLLRGRPTTGAVDERWYWATALLSDKATNAETHWIENDLREAFESDETDEEDAAAPEASNWELHIKEVADLDADDLGRPPDDLLDVLTYLALAGPGNCGLRALSRITGDTTTVDDTTLRTAALQVAWAFRNLFNLPETIRLLRPRDTRTPYWRLMLEYCAAGNLQAVLDEYFHIIPESAGLITADTQKVADAAVATVRSAVGLRTTFTTADLFEVDDNRISSTKWRMRNRFAVRFGSDRADEGGEANRTTQVRDAFNSPFWPFVLATTSVGQEGLDFHQYCHAVVHWNLPSNPVDLEQREGRVHRYKGHAVRKNVAAVHGCTALALASIDPWAAMFADAVTKRPGASNDLVPYWVYATPNGARIERHVPSLALSRDVPRLDALHRTLGAYRLVMGQARQDDLLRYLQGLMTPDELLKFAARLRIDLAPRSPEWRPPESLLDPILPPRRLLRELSATLHP